MKEFIKSLLPLIGALIVSCLMLTIGPVYSLGYSIWRTSKEGDFKYFLRFWWRLIDGVFSVVGYLIYEIAYSLDLAWNIFGEVLEDTITHKDQTEFGKKGVSVSASVGKLEIEGDLNPFGRFFSYLLNIVFNQKQHARDAWNYLKAKNELKSKYYQKRK